MSGVRNMRSGIDSINRLKGALRDLPLRIRSAVAKDAAEILTRELRADYAAGLTVFDEPRPLSVKGQKLTLVKSGRTYSDVYFTAVGTILRASLGTKYAKYLIGKYRILPQKLPVKWSAQLEQIVREYREDFERELAR